MKSAAHDRPGRTTISAVGDGVLLQNPASNSPESSLKLDRSALLRAYGIMRTIREFEERLVQMEAAAKVNRVIAGFWQELGSQSKAPRPAV